MNETFDIKDMNISLDAFGSPPIKGEGQAVSYDMEEQVMEIPVYETEVQIDGAEEVNE